MFWSRAGESSCLGSRSRQQGRWLGPEGMRGVWEPGASSRFPIQVTVEPLCGEESVRGEGAISQTGCQSLAGQLEVVGGCRVVGVGGLGKPLGTGTLADPA